MKKQTAFLIPIIGLTEGVHEYRFEIDAAFFEAYEDSKITEGDITVDLELDKRAGHIDLDFKVSGTTRVQCDRCLDDLNLPLDFEESLVLKYSEEEKEDYEVVYIKRDRDVFDVSQFIYEFIHLAVPMVRTHDMAGQECNPDMMDILDANEYDQSESDENLANSAWSALKDIKLD